MVRAFDGATGRRCARLRHAPSLAGASGGGVRTLVGAADHPSGVTRLRTTPTLRTMKIGENVTHRGRMLVLLGHDPMSVPDRYAQVSDPETGERFEVAYDELEPVRPEPQGFDPAA